MDTSALLQDAALLVTALGLLCGVLTAVRLHDVRQGLAVLLEFLVGAGLLRLADDPTYQALLTTAVIIAVRKLVMWSLARSRPDRVATAPG